MMDLLRHHVLKRFAHKKIGKQVIGTVVIRYLQKNYDQNIGGFVKHHIVFITTHDLALKMRLFQDRENILKTLTHHLLALGYSYELQMLRFR